MLIPNRIDLQAKKDKREKGKMLYNDTRANSWARSTIINMYTTNKIYKAKPDRTEGRNIDSSITTVGNFKASLSMKGRPTRKMIKQTPWTTL